MSLNFSGGRQSLPLGGGQRGNQAGHGAEKNVEFGLFKSGSQAGIMVFLGASSIWYGVAMAQEVTMESFLFADSSIITGCVIAGLVLAFALVALFRYGGKSLRSGLFIFSLGFLIPMTLSYYSMLFMMIPGAEPQYCLTASVSCLITFILAWFALIFLESFRDNEVINSKPLGPAVQFFLYFFPFAWMVCSIPPVWVIHGTSYGAALLTGEGFGLLLHLPYAIPSWLTVCQNVTLPTCRKWCQHA